MYPTRLLPACFLALFGASVPAAAQCLLAELFSPDPRPDDFLGHSIAMSAEYAVVGVPQFSGGFGEAHVYRREGDQWVFEDTLEAGVAVTGDQFGFSVDVDGDWAIVGAPGGRRAYVFQRTGPDDWVERSTLFGQASSIAHGHAVAIDGDFAIVGDPTAPTAAGGSGGGRAQIYERNGTTWSLVDVVGPEAPASGGRFGYSVDILGTAALVGDPGPVSGSGAVYYYGRASTTGLWPEVDVATAPSAAADGEFGISVAMAAQPLAAGGPLIAVGARNQDLGSFSDVGAIHLYEVPPTIFPQQPMLVHALTIHGSAAEPFGGFGSSVDLQFSGVGPAANPLIAIGAPNVGNGKGSVYLFEVVGSAVSQTGLITSPGSFSFGFDVAFGSGAVGVGDWLAVKPWNSQGLGRIYALDSKACGVSADIELIDLGAGGAVQFSIDMGTAHAGDTYWLLGSASGTYPGIFLFPETLPLNFDIYTEYTILVPNNAVLPGSFGTLDGSGRGTAGLQLPAGANPKMSGQVWHHAVVVFDGVSAIVERTSAPVSVALR